MSACQNQIFAPMDNVETLKEELLANVKKVGNWAGMDPNVWTTEWNLVSMMSFVPDPELGIWPSKLAVALWLKHGDWIVNHVQDKEHRILLIYVHLDLVVEETVKILMSAWCLVQIFAMVEYVSILMDHIGNYWHCEIYHLRYFWTNFMLCLFSFNLQMWMSKRIQVR